VLVGIADSTLEATLAESAQVFKTYNLTMAQTYLDGTQSWDNGMIGPYYIDQCAGATKALVTIPMLVGPRLGGTSSATLSSALSTSGPISSLPVNPLPAAINCWTGFLVSGTNNQQLLISTPVSQGATSIPLDTPITPNYAYPSGTMIDASGSGPGATTSPQNSYNVTTPTGMTLSDVANGVWDNLFTQTFQTIANANSAAILRIGWEIYGNGWYPWNGPANASAYKAAYIHLVEVARAVSSSFKFDWNGGLAYADYDPMTQGAWPGANYVDYVSADIYDTNTSSGSTGWSDAVADMSEGLAFAQTNGKLFSIPEFGISNTYGDDPAWIEAAYYWMRANASSLGYMMYFDYDSLNDYPNSQAVFSSLFGAWVQQQLGSTTHRFLTTGTDRYRIK